MAVKDMTANTLYVDFGNTRLKWRIGDRESLVARGTLRYRDDPQSWSRFYLPRGLIPDRIVASSVASNEGNERFLRWCHEMDFVEPQFAIVRKRFRGLTVAYDDTRKLGVDRWLAMLGARDLVAGAVCVADAGTATTLDAVDSDGVHLGGLIAPGPDTMAASLLDGTARIREASDIRPKHPFAADTGDAVRNGALYANAALIDRFAQETMARLDGPVSVFLTGGARHAVAPLIAHEIREEPDLVLRGLSVLGAGEDDEDVANA